MDELREEARKNLVRAMEVHSNAQRDLVMAKKEEQRALIAKLTAERIFAMTVDCPYEPCGAKAGEKCWEESLGTRHQLLPQHGLRLQAARNVKGL